MYNEPIVPTNDSHKLSVLWMSHYNPKEPV